MRFENLHDNTQKWIRAAVNEGHPAEAIIYTLHTDGHPQDINEAVYQYLQEIYPREQSPLIPDQLRSTESTRFAYDKEVQVLLTLDQPHVILFGDFLSSEECDQIVADSKPKLRPSTVINAVSGSYDTDNQIRTSYGSSFKRKENDLVKRVEKRISALTGCPEKHAEPIQILNYAPGAEYKPHMDYFDPKFSGNANVLAMGGQRYATLIMYLNDVDVGGSTVFPKIGLDILPRKGCALYFAYANQNGWLDHRTLHGGSPVISGEKWIATKWMRFDKYTGPLA
ncbi:2OG-Fe(II) oxygenase [Aliikangiella maris]|uniref:2OG-Fe(II) oxygenase n=2 Tax=Aliikangiella maris TaxID=3162458 RepID=A0ABV3MK98_9GAMM